MSVNNNARKNYIINPIRLKSRQFFEASKPDFLTTLDTEKLFQSISKNKNNTPSKIKCNIHLRQKSNTEEIDFSNYPDNKNKSSNNIKEDYNLNSNRNNKSLIHVKVKHQFSGRGNKKQKLMFSNNRFNRKILIISILFLLCFSFISYELYDLIINKNEYYDKELSIRTNRSYVGRYAKRGRILDRNGKVIVDNEEVYTLNYIKPTNITSKKEIELVKKLIDILDLDYKNVTSNDIKNYIYFDKAQKLFLMS